MPAGRPQLVDPGSLYAFAHQFYWDFRGLAEGSSRWGFDEKKYEQLVLAGEKADVQLSPEERRRLKDLVEEEIRSGRLKQSEKKTRLADIEAGHLSATRDWLSREAAEESRKMLKIPGEPDVLEALMHAKTPQQVSKICADAFVSVHREVEPGVTRELKLRNWPIASGSMLPHYLSEHAQQFIDARKDPRFPSSARPSNQLKQLWFLSRALAGAIFGVKTRTAINLVGSKRPEQVFNESRSAKPARKRSKRRE